MIVNQVNSSRSRKVFTELFPVLDLGRFYIASRVGIRERIASRGRFSRKLFYRKNILPGLLFVFCTVIVVGVFIDYFFVYVPHKQDDINS